MAPSDLKSTCIALLEQALAAVAPGSAVAVQLERPKQRSHGDYACNLAMQLSKPLGRPPREIAAQLIAALPASGTLEKAEIAGPGFINLTVSRAARRAVVHLVRAQGAAYGRRSPAHRPRVQVEFVSANPTGPLHVGHGRGAAYGASLANVLEAAGSDVSREYYVNDAGRQMDILALSTWLRYLDHAGEAIEFPPNGYQGDYVRDMARSLADAHGAAFVRPAAAVIEGTPGLPAAGDDDPAAKARRETHLDALIDAAKRLLGDGYAIVHRHALDAQLGDCRDDLDGFGVTFDRWYSERSLFDGGAVAQAVDRLQQAGHLYRENGALWFRSTAFGDEKDRVVQRENGAFTYFASDIAYHLDKFERGFDRVIDVWGADHHGYIPRVMGALRASGADADRLTVALVQFAVLYRNGEKVSMSTRSGQFVTLRELRGEVGNDAARFFYVLRKSDQHLDFDLDLAKSRSNENPVYYIQYAHARICSVFEAWTGEAEQAGLHALDAVDLSPLDNLHELALVDRLSAWPEVLDLAASELSVHGIAFYLKDLAGDLHSYYNAEKVLVDDEPVRLARLALLDAVRTVLASALALLGVSAPARM
ncbi:MAG: arginine--tRNA ligase [Burkholderiales bacterium]|nr:arginine--tRNA ligase [Burkholderiales bacterium]